MLGLRLALPMVAVMTILSTVVSGVAPPELLGRARQLVLVVTPGWDDVRGELRRYERPTAGDPWQAVGVSASIVVGKSGMAWDPLAEAVVPGPWKREGDGRSPAGVFSVGTAFGFAPEPAARLSKLPYLPLVEGIECVDDPASSLYNQLVDRRKVLHPDWNSSERMREVGEAYRWGVVVNYNTPAVAGRGSCIFLHIGGDGGRGTAGCTAMAADVLRGVMSWLDPQASPVVVQLPQGAYEQARGRWRLP